MLGDVVISLPTACRQAQEYKTSIKHEILRLLIHGFLHLIGYDHERGQEDAEVMEKKERDLLGLIN